MTEIYLNKESADRCVSRVEDLIGDLRDAAASIDRTMTELREYWRGNSANKTQAEYEDNYKSILTQTIPDAVEQLKEMVRKCTDAISETDQQLL